MIPEDQAPGFCLLEDACTYPDCACEQMQSEELLPGWRDIDVTDLFS